jgi:hypothetical protein
MGAGRTNTADPRQIMSQSHRRVETKSWHPGRVRRRRLTLPMIPDARKMRQPSGCGTGRSITLTETSGKHFSAALRRQKICGPYNVDIHFARRMLDRLVES